MKEKTDKRNARRASPLAASAVARMADRIPGVLYRCRNDERWTFEYISAGCLELTGYSPQDFLGNKAIAFVDIIEPEDRTPLFARIRQATDTQATFRVTYRLRTSDGQQKWVWEQGNAVRDAAGRVVAFEGYITDITDGKEAEMLLRHSESRMREQAELLDHAREAIIVRDTDHRIHYWNKGAERLYGWTEQEAIGRIVTDLLYDTTEKFDEASHVLFRDGAWSGHLIHRRKDGSRLDVEAYWTLVSDTSGNPRAIFSINNDITQRKEAEAKIQQLAYYDALTGLPNRPLLLDRLRHYLGSSARTGGTGALMFIDLDRFKLLNDTMGHDMGDLLLKQVASRLISCVRHSDTVARFGGDEFVILLESLNSDLDKAALQAEHVAEKILAAFAAPFRLHAYEHACSPSIGITMFRDEQNNENDILKRADTAMYQAKGAGRNTFRFFDAGMQELIESRALFEAELRRGSARHEFLLHYQPQVSRDGTMVGAEALLRWQSPAGGLINASQFIAIAEDSDLILQLGQWVLEAGCMQLARWAQHPATAHFTLSVNVSSRQFRHPQFVQQVLDELERSGADPGKLKLELSESALLKNIADTARAMDILRARGVRFSLDDFGTGFSSLSYLRSLPFAELKIDQSFISDITTNQINARLATSIMALGNSLGMSVVAEGVEMPQQHDFLAMHGCDAYQGYLFGIPVPADRLLQAG